MKKSITIALAALAVVGVSMRNRGPRSHREGGGLAFVDRRRRRCPRQREAHRQEPLRRQAGDQRAEARPQRDLRRPRRRRARRAVHHQRRRQRPPPVPQPARTRTTCSSASIRAARSGRVRNAAGQDVLAVQLADSRSLSGGDIICCIPDDSGPECEDRTPAECAAQGGTVTTATSCLPNPCAGTPPPVGATSSAAFPTTAVRSARTAPPTSAPPRAASWSRRPRATPNPCASVTPPANDDVQCCLPDDSGTECEDRTPAACAVEGGVNAGAGTCTPDPCRVHSAAVGERDGDRQVRGALQPLEDLGRRQRPRDRQLSGERDLGRQHGDRARPARPSVTRSSSTSTATPATSPPARRRSLRPSSRALRPR